MWERIKEWFAAFRNIEDDEEDDSYDGHDLSVDLMRKLLGSITGSEVPKKKDEMTQGERKAYVQMVAAFYPEIIEPRMKNMVHAQEQLMARGSVELREIMPSVRDQIIFARGTINGLMLAQEDFQEDFQEYVGSRPSNEVFDKYKMFPELFKKEERSDAEE